MADTHDLSHDSSVWVHPARLLDMTASEYATFLINEWKVDHIHYYNKDTSRENCGLLYFWWKKYDIAHKYQLFINRKAKEKNWTI